MRLPPSLTVSITDSNCKRFSRCCDGEMFSCWRYGIMPGHITHPSLWNTSLGGRRHARADVRIAHARCNSRHGDLGRSHHLYGDGVHHLCESCHPELCWHARTHRAGTRLRPYPGRYLPHWLQHAGSFWRCFSVPWRLLCHLRPLLERSLSSAI